MRQTCLDMVYELARNDRRVFFIGSDLGIGVLGKFRKEMPDRFLMEGVSEANVIGVAAGLAMEGKIVYVNTIATFLTRRCFEQLVLDLCLHHANVRLIGSGGGLVYAPLGPTHLAIEDLAILRAVPNMTIIAPADAEEMRLLMPQTLGHDGPIYIRLAKGFDPIVTKQPPTPIIGRAVPMREGTDVLLVTTGVTLQIAITAADSLSQNGIDAAILHVHTVKPIDIETVIRYASPTQVVVTIEEHTVIGGLGSAIAEIIAEAGFRSPKRFRRIGIPDVFSVRYGSQSDLMEHYGITSRSVVEVVSRLFSDAREAS